MAEKISQRKWRLLGLGLANIVLLFLPIARGEIHDYYVLSIPGAWGTFLFLSLIYFLLLVPMNEVYARFYSTEYYDNVIKVMNVVIPILGVIALILSRDDLELASNGSLTLVYYGLYVIIVIEHAYNWHFTFKELY